MLKLAVIGAGGHARTVGAILSYNKNINLVGYIDSKSRKDELIFGKRIIVTNDIPAYLAKEQIKDIFLAIGDNSKRGQAYEELSTEGLRFINAIHPTAIIEKGATLGQGVLIGAGVVMGALVTIGDNVIINNGAIIDHETVIEDHVHIGPGAKIAGRVSIGKGVFVGIGSTIRDKVSIGAGAVIGAGSVVLDDIPAYTIAAGIPARIIKS